MIVFFKEAILPYAVWLLMLACTVLGIFKRAEWPLLLMAGLVSLPTLWYPSQALPLGSQTLTLLVVSSLIGISVNGPGYQRAPKQGLMFMLFFTTYLAVWNSSLRYGLSLPLTTDNPVLANWKNYVMMLALYFVAFNLLRTEADVRKLLMVMMGVVLFIIMQNYRSTLAGESFSYAKRAAGPFETVGLNPNHFGAFLAHYGVAALGLFLMDRDFKRRCLYAAIFIGGVYPLFYTYSRGAYLAVLVAVFVIGLIRYRPFLLLVLVIALSWETILPDSVVDRIKMTHNENGDLEESAALRLVVWDLARNLFADNPVFGIGFEGFIYASQGLPLHNTHNFYLQVAAEQGVIGLLLLGLLLLRTFWTAWKLFRTGATPFAKGIGLGLIASTTALSVSNLFGDRFSQLALGSFYFLLMGMAERLLAIAREPSSPPASTARASGAATGARPHVSSTPAPTP